MSEATPPPDPQPPAGAVPAGPTAAPEPWAPPDRPAAPPSGPALDPRLSPPTRPAEAAPGSATPIDEPAEPGRGRDGRTSTVILSVFAVVVLAVCGLLGVAGLLVNLPVDPFGRPTAAEPRQDGPTTTDEGENEDPDAEAAEGGQPAPTPTPSRRPAATPSSGPGRFAVAYEVTGQGPANIQYYDADGYLVELDRVRLPWHTTIRTDDPSRASVMANKGDDKGGRTIACAMTVNGGRPVTESVDERGWRVGCGG